MEDETISALGGLCSELLGSETFQALIALNRQQYAADILATQPHETKRREQIYASSLGFESFMGLVAKFADASEKLHTHTAVAAYPDYTDDPSVHDLYDGRV